MMINNSYTLDKKAIEQANLLIEEAQNLICLDMTPNEEKRLEELVSKIAEIYQNNLSNVIDGLYSEDNPRKQYLLTKVIRKVVNEIENRSNYDGIIYQVKNSFGAISYLIGTIHKGSFQMVKKSPIDQLILNAAELITEVGISEGVLRAIWVMEKSYATQLSELNKIRYHMDLNFTLLALNQDIKISGLETAEDQFKDLELARQERTLNYFSSIENLNKFAIHAMFIDYECIQAWQNGDERKLRSLGQDYTIRKEATVKWLKNCDNDLINKLQKTKVSICIAVGALHLFGKKGLVKAFESNGLELTKISCSDIPKLVPFITGLVSGLYGVPETGIRKVEMLDDPIVIQNSDAFKCAITLSNGLKLLRMLTCEELNEVRNCLPSKGIVDIPNKGISYIEKGELPHEEGLFLCYIECEDGDDIERLLTLEEYEYLKALESNDLELTKISC